MKKLISSVFALALIFGSVAKAPQEKVVYAIDTENSSIEWLGKKVTGQHDGVIEVKSGSIVLENNQPVGGEIVIDMNSLRVTDLKDEEMNGKLVSHLKSNDFFGVESFPTSSFTIKEVTKVEGENLYNIKGEMTIRGITHPEEFIATILVKDNKVAAIGEMSIDRSKYDVKYGSDEFFEDLGDKMIYDDFVLKFKIGAK